MYQSLATNSEFSLHILVPPCSFFEYYRQWEEFILFHKDQCLIVYYEDMHKVVFLIYLFIYLFIYFLLSDNYGTLEWTYIFFMTTSY